MERKKDILILMASFAGGGAEKVMIDLLHRFDRQRYNLTVVVLWGYGPNLENVPEDIELIKLFDRDPGFFDNRTRSWRFIHDRIWRRRLLKSLEGRTFDVTISFMEGQTALLHSFIFDRSPVNISWIHIDIEKNWWYRFLMDRRKERMIYERMDYVVCVSQGVRDSFVRAVGELDNLCVIYNIIERDAIRKRADEFKVDHKRFTVVNMARLQPEKCQYRLIEAAKILKDRGYDFDVWILGTGKLESELKNQAASVGVSDRVKLLGFKKNPMPYIKAADLFVLSSDAEGYSLVTCEAMCLDLPVVSTRVAGPEELLAGDFGMLVDKNDSEHIADAIEKFITNPETREFYKRKAREKSISFSPEDVIAKIEGLWNETVH